MDIKIRNLDADIVARLDTLAGQSGLSRNEYLKAQLERVAMLGKTKQTEDQYAYLVDSVTAAIRQNTDALTEFLRIIGEENQDTIGGKHAR
jgi:hypothetical protein